MAILVLGGRGLVGARVTKQLASMGVEVVCFDRYPYTEKPQSNGRVKMIVGDITRIEDIISAIKEFGVERIINLAYILGAESEVSLHAAVVTNIMGTNNVFEAARLMGIKRVVLASSIAVYGLQSSFGERPVTEEDHCYPTIVYGAHKMLNEFMARKYIDHYGMSIASLRIPTVGGPGRTTGYSAWASIYVDYPAVGRPVEIPGHLNRRILITYVDDVAKILARLCLSETLRYPVYNAYTHSVTFLELVDAVRKYIPEAEIRLNKKGLGHPLVYYLSSERLEKEFQMNCPALEVMVKKHIDEVREALGLSAISEPGRN